MDGRTGSNLDLAGLEIDAVLVNSCDSCVKDQQFLEIGILVQERGEFTSAVAGICGIS